MAGYVYKGNRFDEPDPEPEPAPPEPEPAITQPHSPTQLRPCGTPAAYRRHIYNNQKPCPQCRTAWTEHFQKRNRAKGIKPKPEPQPCGTYAAYQRHKKQGEQACTPCAIAANQYSTQLRTRTKEAA